MELILSEFALFLDNRGKPEHKLLSKKIPKCWPRQWQQVCAFRDPNWNGKSCTHTSHLDNPWWAVNLTQQHCIHQVHIVNRDVRTTSVCKYPRFWFESLQIFNSQSPVWVHCFEPLVFLFTVPAFILLRWKTAAGPGWSVGISANSGSQSWCRVLPRLCILPEACWKWTSPDLNVQQGSTGQSPHHSASGANASHSLWSRGFRRYM